MYYQTILIQAIFKSIIYKPTYFLLAHTKIHLKWESIEKFKELNNNNKNELKWECVHL